MPTDTEQSNFRTHRFRYSRWAARRTAAFMMIILYAFLIWPLFSRGSGLNSWMEVIVIAIATIVALVYVIISRHPITRLLVGPDGLHAPYGLLRQVGWHEIDSAEYIQKRPLFLPPREWLVLSLKPEAGPLSRLPVPARVENWLIRKAGLRIPLHMLRAPSGEVLSSIERFMPVVEMDLQTDVAASQRIKDSF